MPLNPAGNWYQQFMPNLGGRTIQDIEFLDSLTGYATARQTGDTSYVLKTTNGGDNWQIVYRNFFAMTQIQFLNVNTGYAAGAYLFKTTNGGFNWNVINAPAGALAQDMHVLNTDTIWIAHTEITRNLYRTTNGGASWTLQFTYPGSLTKIYMYNARIGFFSTLFKTYKTTNSGLNWSEIIGQDGFKDIHFVDSLTGWKANGPIKKTINGGANWVTQVLPTGGVIITSGILNFSVLNRDTLWAVGGLAVINSLARGIVFRTTNGGDNWLFQIPDTSIPSNTYYSYTQFINSKIGWAHTLLIGIHTTDSGDATWLTPVSQISSEIPKEFILHQNYPNPFNPNTNIRYQLKVRKFVKLKVFDISGRELIELVNEEQPAGTYEVDFSGYGYSSGIYFYSLIVNGALVSTKKMALVK
jgi:photosystem II stability/assembly factor-like uncharacterized protein